MAAPKIFVSSTCYDMGIIRSQLRNFIVGLGYDPVMSEFSDILFDHRLHTHTSCLKEIPNCDMLVLIIGSRFGGKGTPEAVASLDIESLKKLSANQAFLGSSENLSVTQLEVLSAISERLPTFCFVDSRVLHDHQLYEANKANGLADKIKYPSIEKAETAQFIFEFINFLRLRVTGNSVFSFSKMEDIEQNLRRQWSAWYQRLLSDERRNDVESRQIDNMASQLESLKTAILAAMPDTDARDIARSVVKYRDVVDFLQSIGTVTNKTLMENISIFEVLLKSGVVEIAEIPHARLPGRTNLALILQDRTFYESRFTLNYLSDKFAKEWADFKKLKPSTKEVVIETTAETGGRHYLQYRDEKIEEVLKTASEDLRPEDQRQLVTLDLNGLIKAFAGPVEKKAPIAPKI